jgi:hypothetical protein
MLNNPSHCTSPPSYNYNKWVLTSLLLSGMTYSKINLRLPRMYFRGAVPFKPKFACSLICIEKNKLKWNPRNLEPLCKQHRYSHITLNSEYNRNKDKV